MDGGARGERVGKRSDGEERRREREERKGEIRERKKERKGRDLSIHASVPYLFTYYLPTLRARHLALYHN